MGLERSYTPWDFRRGEPNKIKNKIAGAYHGNPRSHAFHAQGCKNFNCKNCPKIFHDRETEVKPGYKSCGICNP